MVGLDNPIHILLLLTIVLLVFGAKRLPEMGRSLGSGLRGFKESINGEGPTKRPAELAMVSSETTDPGSGRSGEPPRSQPAPAPEE